MRADKEKQNELQRKSQTSIQTCTILGISDCHSYDWITITHFSWDIIWSIWRAQKLEK